MSEPMSEHGDDLSAEELCRLCRVSAQWLIAHVDDGLIAARAGASVTQWRFDAVSIHRVRRLSELETHFDAAPELAALVADLEHEVRRLRAQVKRWQG